MTLIMTDSTTQHQIESHSIYEQTTVNIVDLLETASMQQGRIHLLLNANAETMRVNYEKGIFNCIQYDEEPDFDAMYGLKVLFIYQVFNPEPGQYAMLKDELLFPRAEREKGAQASRSFWAKLGVKSKKAQASLQMLAKSGTSCLMYRPMFNKLIIPQIERFVVISTIYLYDEET